MGSPATTNIFDQKINKVFNGDYDVKKVKSFYSIGHLLSNYKNVRKFAETVKDNEALFDFLKWNFEEGGFWGKLREFKPDILVMDLFTEIYFGSFILPDGTYITRNFRLMDKNSIPEDAILFNTSISVYIPKIVEQVNTFKTRVNEVSPNTKIVINGARFPEHMSKDDVIQENYNAKKFGFSTEKIKSFNWNWELLDYELMKNGFKVLKFDQENSAAELNFPTGKNWYYLYNQNYYTDVQSQIEKFAESYNLGPTTLSIELDAEVDLSKVNQDVVFLHVPNKSNDLKIFRKKGEARNIALKLAAKDYVLHGNKGTEYRFVKRGQLKSVYPKFKNVHYRILPPKDEKKYWSNRLLVRMMSFGVHFKTSMMERNFQADFKTLKDSVVKNTYILEIGDINLINGSFYTNTKNYPNYENEIQELISMIADKYGIDHENIVLYGASRGGVGAVLHGTLGNYKFIAADPVINDTPWYQENDIHFVNGVRDVDLTKKIINCLENYKRPNSCTTPCQVNK